MSDGWKNNPENKITKRSEGKRVEREKNGKNKAKWEEKGSRIEKPITFCYG